MNTWTLYAITLYDALWCPSKRRKYKTFGYHNVIWCLASNKDILTFEVHNIMLHNIDKNVNETTY